jgi:hypothetical protein
MGEPRLMAVILGHLGVIMLAPPATFEQAIADDRRWFAEHPDNNVRIRRPLPGEFYPYDGLENEVELVRIERQPDGSRHRRPLLAKERSGE